MKVAEAAAEVLRAAGTDLIWYGRPDLMGEIADLAGIKARHPLNVSACVMRCCAKSALFERAGYIEHLGRDYVVQRLRVDQTTTNTEGGGL